VGSRPRDSVQKGSWRAAGYQATHPGGGLTALLPFFEQSPLVGTPAMPHYTEALAYLALKPASPTSHIPSHPRGTALGPLLLFATNEV